MFQLLKVSADGITLSTGQINVNIPTTAVFKVEFTAAVDTQAAKESILIFEFDEDDSIPLTYSFENDARRILVSSEHPLGQNKFFRLVITDALQSSEGVEFPGIEYNLKTKAVRLQLEEAFLNENDLLSAETLREIAFDDIRFEFRFSDALDEQSVQSFFNFEPSVAVNYSLSDEGRVITITNTEPLDYYRFHSVSISSSLSSVNDFEFEGFTAIFQTGLNPNPKFPLISDEELLDKIQEATFRYFWDFSHPVSGLARERNTSGELVTIGGSGFGLKAILTGINRGFISRNEGIDRFRKIVDFLADADRFHGAWSHWLNGSTGRVIPFSANDDGGDLVETAFMAQGLITVRQFLDENVPEESKLIDDINFLLDTIEWNWFTRNNRDVLFWHWSPIHEWAINLQIKGYNEALITYILAASSSDFSIDPDVYHKGWASSGGIQSGKSFYGITLPLGFDYGGPLFFTHYSFLGLDPRNLSDRYADYWIQNRNHTLINREHSIVNPGQFIGYSSDSWGLTASDDPFGYNVHDPVNDNGTVTPTAAISSIPYTPDESMEAIRHFYFILGDKLWGEYGFFDAFNPTEGWWADSYLAIDQGPIIIMIENYRSALLWDLFMSAPEVQHALDRLDFQTGL
ncbi:MAG: glucoamylase family protein [Balneolaceae bacterium]